jgi:NADH-quinone oxidoreductase subunit L
MICAIGLAAPGAAMFHLFTHAFFKALLFLGAGAIIHMMHHEQDIWKMGGLSGKMKWTFLSFAAGYLALIGTPFFSGFFSKDVILLAAWQQNKFIFLLALFTAFLTAFYMTRLFVVTFLGRTRSEAANHAHDGPMTMTAPLVILGVLSVIAGYAGIAHVALGETFSHAIEAIEQGGGHGIVATLAVCAFLGGVGAGYVLYQGQAKEPFPFAPLKDKLYFDEIYAALIAGTQDLIATIARYLDQWLIDGVLVRGSSGLAWAAGFVLRFLQFGNLQGYAFLFGLGVVATIYLLVFR